MLNEEIGSRFEYESNIFESGYLERRLDINYNNKNEWLN